MIRLVNDEAIMQAIDDFFEKNNCCAKDQCQKYDRCTDCQKEAIKNIVRATPNVESFGKFITGKPEKTGLYLIRLKGDVGNTSLQRDYFIAADGGRWWSTNSNPDSIEYLPESFVEATL